MRVVSSTHDLAAHYRSTSPPLSSEVQRPDRDAFQIDVIATIYVQPVPVRQREHTDAFRPCVNLAVVDVHSSGRFWFRLAQAVMGCSRKE